MSEHKRCLVCGSYTKQVLIQTDKTGELKVFYKCSKYSCSWESEKSIIYAIQSKNRRLEVKDE